ncbi:MAG: hypothetical protein JWQ32_458 [Marmoricola sp.]|nr:hypothetical protein [Marmoricola sp.]
MRSPRDGGRSLIVVSTAVVWLAVSVLALPAATARAPGQRPAVTTGSATAVRQTSATVNGTVNSYGFATTVRFQYGTTTSYGNGSTGAVAAGGGTGSVGFHADLIGLAPGTTYHYRAVATNKNGTAFGGDKTFITPMPPTVVTGAATAVQPTTATLTGTVDPAGSATTVSFQYGTSAAYGSSTAAVLVGSGNGSVGIHADLKALAPATTYHYRAVATNRNGTTDGFDNTFTTGKASGVTTGAASAVRQTTATLTGTVDQPGSATTVNFEYGTSVAYGSTTPAVPVGSATASITFYADLTGLVPGVTYHYRAVATSQSGSADGTDRTFTTTKPPTAATGGATGLTATSATLNATADPSGAATTVTFEYGSSSAYSSNTPAQVIGSGNGPVAFHATITGLVAGTTYHFRAVATNQNGTTAGADHTFTAPAATQTPTATATDPPTADPTIAGTSASSPPAASPSGNSGLWAWILAVIAVVAGGVIVAAARLRPQRPGS